MMTPDDGLRSAIAAVALLLVWILVMHFYREYRVDVFRQRMFVVRDELFDYAADGNLSFDHPAYTLVRTTMNGFIRFADRMTVSALLTAAYATAGQTDPADSFHARYERATAELSDEQKAFVGRAVYRMHLHVAEQLVYSSPILLLGLVPTLAILLAKRASTEAARRLLRRAFPAKWSLAVDNLALNYGDAMVYA
jgi:hypothetical protein